MTRQRLSSSEFLAKMAMLSDLLSYRLDDLLVSLGVRYRDNDGVLTGPCPVHKGNNPTAWQMYRNVEGDYPPGMWRCYSHHCHQNHKPTLFGFVQAIYGGDFKRALDHCLSILRLNSLDEVKVDLKAFEKKEWVRNAESFRPQENATQGFF